LLCPLPHPKKLSSLFVTHCDSYTVRACEGILHDDLTLEEEGLLGRNFQWMWTGRHCPILLGSLFPLALHHLIELELGKITVYAALGRGAPMERL